MGNGVYYRNGEFFYEEDEPVEDVIAAFEAGEKGLTVAPPTAPRPPATG
ncbi:MAG TPA: hypothetical protein VFQ85_12520 [Mycobacteriales bacterium]|nr:hypothetical protein [Mycobacteriales bacterium]